ncbi:MAG TPA: ImmA/IrrE family metallo-endopeptidase [Rudaea sp.]|nr:ImmA/IrrE family metallo-endopeptidase [Rudaea sp.]
MHINGNMVVLAREIRGMTQQYLASRMAASLYALSRIERGIHSEVSERQALAIANALGFPLEFLMQRDELVGSGSGPCCSGGKTALEEIDQKRIRGVLSALHIHIRQLRRAVDVVAERTLPKFARDQLAGSAMRAAQALRSFWDVPEGPIANLTELVESTGAVVVRCDFGMSAIGAASVRPDGAPPLVLIDRTIPGDQSRLVLAHQLAHLVMHGSAFPKMEREADEFAHEFLLPQSSMRAAFARADVTLADLVSLRTQWQVPVAALLDRACAMKLIDAKARNRLWTSAKVHGYLLEPRSLPHEAASNLRRMLDCFLRTRGLGPGDLADVFKIGMHDIAAWYGQSMPPRRRPDQHHETARIAGATPGAVVVRPAARLRRGATADRR